MFILILPHFFVQDKNKDKEFSIEKIEQNRQKENKEVFKGKFVAKIPWEFFRRTF